MACSTTTCSTPPSYSNAAVRFSGPYLNGYKAEYDCNAGFKNTGPSSKVCSVSGPPCTSTWTDDPDNPGEVTCSASTITEDVTTYTYKELNDNLWYIIALGILFLILLILLFVFFWWCCCRECCRRRCMRSCRACCYCCYDDVPYADTPRSRGLAYKKYTRRKVKVKSKEQHVHYYSHNEKQDERNGKSNGAVKSDEKDKDNSPKKTVTVVTTEKVQNKNTETERTPRRTVGNQDKATNKTSEGEKTPRRNSLPAANKMPSTGSTNKIAPATTISSNKRKGREETGKSTSSGNDAASESRASMTQVNPSVNSENQDENFDYIKQLGYVPSYAKSYSDGDENTKGGNTNLASRSKDEIAPKDLVHVENVPLAAKPVDSKGNPVWMPHAHNVRPFKTSTK